MTAGYLLSAAAVEKIDAALRKLATLEVGSAKRPGGNFQPRKHFYRIVTNETGGEYTLQKQEWDAAGGGLQDLTNTLSSEYDMAQTGFDYLLRAAGAVDQIVPGWLAFVDGSWVLLIDVGTGASSIPVKLSASNGSGSYTGKEQTWNGSAWADKAGASNITVYNLFETNGPGSMSAVILTGGPIVLVSDFSGRLCFERETNAYYKS